MGPTRDFGASIQVCNDIMFESLESLWALRLPKHFYFSFFCVRLTYRSMCLDQCASINVLTGPNSAAAGFVDRVAPIGGTCCCSTVVVSHLGCGRNFPRTDHTTKRIAWITWEIRCDPCTGSCGCCMFECHDHYDSCFTLTHCIFMRLLYV